MFAVTYPVSAVNWEREENWGQSETEAATERAENTTVKHHPIVYLSAAVKHLIQHSWDKIWVYGFMRGLLRPLSNLEPDNTAAEGQLQKLSCADGIKHSLLPRGPKGDASLCRESFVEIKWFNMNWHGKRPHCICCIYLSLTLMSRT